MHGVISLQSSSANTPNAPFFKHKPPMAKRGRSLKNRRPPAQHLQRVPLFLTDNLRTRGTTFRFLLWCTQILLQPRRVCTDPLGLCRASARCIPHPPLGRRRPRGPPGRSRSKPTERAGQAPHSSQFAYSPLPTHPPARAMRPQVPRSAVRDQHRCYQLTLCLLLRPQRTQEPTMNYF